jgi:3-oxoacyl-[acyl-carrier protein] reductase
MGLEKNFPRPVSNKIIKILLSKGDNAMELKGKVAVITGGASGIGEAVARDLAGEGMKVVVADLNQAEVERVAKEINEAGGQALGVPCNVTSEEDVARLMDRTMEHFGEINVLFPSAGVIKDGLLVSTDKETGKVKKTMALKDFQFVMDVNLTGTFLAIREAASRMIDNGFQGVLFTVSSVNRVGVAGQINYSSTKAAAAIMPEVLTSEFHRKKIMGIRSVSISPGFVGTAMVKGMNQKALDSILANVPIARLIEPQEIADLVKFCIRNEAMHGVNIDIHGGLRHGI